MITVLPIKEKDITACSLLLDKNFQANNFFSEEYLHWLYFRNPLGKVIGFNAWSGKKLVAHYATIPIGVLRNEIRENSLLSINSVTDSKFRKQGLFSLLAKKTYSKGSKAGYTSVIAVANKASTPSFQNSLGFDLICPLEVSIGLGSLNINTDLLKELSVFRRDWSAQDILWRKQNPNKQVVIVQKGSIFSISSKINKLFNSYTETPFIHNVKENTLSDKVNSFKFRVFVGKMPQRVKNLNFYIKLPDILKPAPFNLVFKSLGDQQPPPNVEDVFFNFFDFDVL